MYYSRIQTIHLKAAVDLRIKCNGHKVFSLCCLDYFVTILYFSFEE